MRKFPLKLI